MTLKNSPQSFYRYEIYLTQRCKYTPKELHLLRLIHRSSRVLWTIKHKSNTHHMWNIKFMISFRFSRDFLRNLCRILLLIVQKVFNKFQYIFHEKWANSKHLQNCRKIISRFHEWNCVLRQSVKLFREPNCFSVFLQAKSA